MNSAGEVEEQRRFSNQPQPREKLIYILKSTYKLLYMYLDSTEQMRRREKQGKLEEKEKQENRVANTGINV